MISLERGFFGLVINKGIKGILSWIYRTLIIKILTIIENYIHLRKQISILYNVRRFYFLPTLPTFLIIYEYWNSFEVRFFGKYIFSISRDVIRQGMSKINVIPR